MQRDEILAKLRERIIAFAASQLSRDLAEDVAQEVLMLLHTKYREVALLEDLLPLSLRIARFKMQIYFLQFRVKAPQIGAHQLHEQRRSIAAVQGSRRGHGYC